MKPSNALAMALFLASCVPTLPAQTYENDTEDGYYLYADVWDTAPYSQGSCSDTTQIILSLSGGTSANVGAPYPQTAHASVKTAIADGGQYTLNREIIHTGTQRGGKCGVIVDAYMVIPIGAGVSATNYKFSVDTGKTCVYSVDCGTVVPTCGPNQGYANTTDSAHPCGDYFLQQFGSLIYSGFRKCIPLGYIPPNYFSGRNSAPAACN